MWPDNSQAVIGGSRAEQPAGNAMKRVIAALDEAYARLAEADRRQHEPLAIVGMACRSALGDDPEQLWQALLSGRDGVSPIPPDRWTEAGTDAGEAIARREASLLRNVAEFDAAFFGITGREAVSMDPQQRLLLETAWQALEDAAIPREQFSASATGVFVGITSADYSWVLLRAVGVENLGGRSPVPIERRDGHPLRADSGHTRPDPAAGSWHTAIVRGRRAVV